MRKFNFFTLFFMICAFGVGISNAQVPDEIQPEDPRPAIKRLNRPNLLQELGLSREQIRQIHLINQMQKPLRQEAQFRFREANRALDRAIYADAPNENEVRARLKETQLAQAELIKLRSATEFAIRKVLTPEQLIKFRELRQGFMRKSETQTEQLNAPETRPVNNFNRRGNRTLRKRGF